MIKKLLPQKIDFKKNVSILLPQKRYFKIAIIKMILQKCTY